MLRVRVGPPCTEPLSLYSFSRLAQGGMDECVDLLLESGADVDLATTRGSTALMAAVCNGHLGVAAALLRHGIWVNAQDQVRAGTTRGRSPRTVVSAHRPTDPVLSSLAHR